VATTGAFKLREGALLNVTDNAKPASTATSNAATTNAPAANEG
jgi:hypothetical protein